MGSTEPADAHILDQLIQKLLNYNRSRSREPIPLTEDEVYYLATRAISDLRNTSALLECDPPLMICGDTHGQFSDVIRLFRSGGWPPGTRYLFLGDYVDRGPNSIETICLFLAYKCRYPNEFFLLRGNHETAIINRVYGFYDECKERFGSIRVWNRFQEAFNCLPVAGLVATKIFCMHGGLSPELHSFEQIRRMIMPLTIPEQGGLLADLLWSDPMDGISGYINGSRGISYNFGEDAVISFCRKHNIDLIARAHQVVEEGYKFFAGKKLVTIFSAPNYCGEFTNAAGMLAVGASLQCKLKSLGGSRQRCRPRSEVSQRGSASTNSLK